MIYDLLVIGGGINGAGIARDAAMRGLSVCLVEARDWSSGTSSKSSMLAHGGLRYLEQFELGLVHEALQDREYMLKQAPHLVRPLKFVYPIYPHVASRRTVRAGLLLYDTLSYGKSVPSREYLRKEALLDLLPGLEPNELKGGATYYDGQFQSVERFVWELVQDARAHGADCRNYAPVTQLLLNNGSCIGAALADGSEIQAHATINAAGPWVDDVLAPNLPQKNALIRKTKGIHLAVKRFTDVALIVRAQDGRTFFFLPWQEYTLIGTTDTDYPGDAADATAETVDVEYLLAGAKQYFPAADLSIEFTYAGVRPLLQQTGLTESHVSRKHALFDHTKQGAASLWSVQGGKLTTYRHLSEQAVTKVCKERRLKAAKLRPTRSGTLPGGPLVEWENYRAQSIAIAQSEFALPPASAEHLVDTYGAQWRNVLGAATPDGLRKVGKGRPELWCQIEHAISNEDARSVADVMLRRTRLGLVAGGNPRIAHAVAKLMAKRLGWSGTQQKQSEQHYETELQRMGLPKLKAATS